MATNKNNKQKHTQPRKHVPFTKPSVIVEMVIEEEEEDMVEGFMSQLMGSDIPLRDVILGAVHGPSDLIHDPEYKKQLLANADMFANPESYEYDGEIGTDILDIAHQYGIKPAVLKQNILTALSKLGK